MKYLLSIVVFLVFGLCSSAQTDSLTLAGDSVGSIVVSDSLVTQSWFFTGKDLPVINRIAAFSSPSDTKDRYFYFAVVLSLVFSLVFISSKDIVLSSWRSFFRLQYQIQYSRTDKSSNLIYLLVYAMLFVLSLSVLLYYVLQTFFALKTSLGLIVLMCTLYFIWDYYSANLYFLFAGNRKTVEMVKQISLSYVPLWSVLAWFGFFFILLTSFVISKWFAIVLFSILGLSLLIKELRVLQVLWTEKVEVISFHFFAYLCTFKFLPFVLLVWLVF